MVCHSDTELSLECIHNSSDKKCEPDEKRVENDKFNDGECLRSNTSEKRTLEK